jgi:TrmH family RNA methyltransferase
MDARLSNRRRKEINSLTRRKYRKERGQTLIEGVRAVEAALDAEAPLTELIVADGARFGPAVQSLCDRAEVPVHVLPEDEVNRLSDVQTSQGVLAVVETRYVEEDALLDALTPATTMLALDGVQDPGNVGTILRTAAWFGAEAVVAGPGTAGLYGPKVMRAAMGGHWDLRLTRTGALGELLQQLRRQGAHLYGADLQGVRAGAWQPATPSVLVLGSEAHGLSAAVHGTIDERVAIPGAPRRPGAESLNVAVAAGILIYEWTGRGGGTG